MVFLVRIDILPEPYKPAIEQRLKLDGGNQIEEKENINLVKIKD